jgi:NAD(P)H-hydrate epimerase
VFDSLGLPQTIYETQVKDAVTILEAARFPRRRRNSHKTSHGHLLVIGGDYGMGGAAMMSAEAALRTGAGLVSVATRGENTGPLRARCPEIMATGVDNKNQLKPMLERATSVVLGPGLGQSEWSRELFEAALETSLPMVVDADGLSILAKLGLSRDRWILTPHPGEAYRLLNGAIKNRSNDPGAISETIPDAISGVETRLSGVQDDRFAVLKSLQQDYGGVVLLKGVGTLVTDGKEISLCPFGNPGMATAGMGDVLSGIVGALLAQGQSFYNAATIGAVLHAMAGDIAAGKDGERGLIATDLIPIVRRLVNS